MSPTTSISRCGGAGAEAFGSLAVTIAGPDTLRGLWMMDEAAGPFADTSGWSSGPSPMNEHIGASPWLHQVAGCLAPSQDIGFVQSQTAIRGNTYAAALNTLMFQTGVDTAWSAAAWVNATSSLSSWRGAIFHNSTMVGGTPDHEEGWVLEGTWSAGTISFDVSRAVNGVRNIASVAGGFGQCVFLVATYDGANLRLYANGVLQATTADARVGLLTGSISAPTIGEQVLSVGGIFNDYQWYGKIGAVAFWSPTLTPTQVAQLYAAGLS
jgi:Concanavalin A-like lectin/glucanases superfamily